MVERIGEERAKVQSYQRAKYFLVDNLRRYSCNRSLGLRKFCNADYKPLCNRI